MVGNRPMSAFGSLCCFALRRLRLQVGQNMGARLEVSSQGDLRGNGSRCGGRLNFAREVAQAAGTIRFPRSGASAGAKFCVHHLSGKRQRCFWRESRVWCYLLARCGLCSDGTV